MAQRETNSSALEGLRQNLSDTDRPNARAFIQSTIRGLSYERDSRPREQARRQSRDVMASTTAIPRLALNPVEAAASLGVSRDFFDEHVLPQLRVVRKGRKVLVAVAELERWLSREYATLHGASGGR